MMLKDFTGSGKLSSSVTFLSSSLWFICLLAAEIRECLLSQVAIFLIQRNRHALLGRSMDEQDMMRVLNLLSKDPVSHCFIDGA